MRLPQLDERLLTAAELFPACAYGADIGADHGRLSCYLLAKDMCRRMCVADISKASLEKARQLLSLHGLADRADFAVGDGLAALRQKADAIAVLGMGGRTLSGILERGRNQLSGAALILSAHTEIFLVRKALMRIGYRVESERIARAGGRYYVVLRALPGQEAYMEKQLFLGPRLMESGGQHYRGFLEWLAAAALCGRGPEADKRRRWIKEELENACDG